MSERWESQKNPVGLDGEFPMSLGCLTGCLELQMAEVCVKSVMGSRMESESPMGLECLNGCLELQMAQTCLKGEMESPMELECLNGCLES